MQPNPNPHAMFIQIIPFIVVFVVMYFLIIKPQKKKQDLHKQMVAGVKKNDELVTTGGVHGTVVNVKEKTFVLRVDENVRIEIDKGSISYIKKQRNG